MGKYVKPVNICAADIEHSSCECDEDGGHNGAGFVDRSTIFVMHGDCIIETESAFDRAYCSFLCHSYIIFHKICAIGVCIQ